MLLGPPRDLVELGRHFGKVQDEPLHRRGEPSRLIGLGLASTVGEAPQIGRLVDTPHLGEMSHERQAGDVRLGRLLGSAEIGVEEELGACRHVPIPGRIVRFPINIPARRRRGSW
jgi:hypothetical protein